MDLNKNHESLRTCNNSNNIGIIITDFHNKILTCDSTAETIFCFNKKDIVGRELEEVLHSTRVGETSNFFWLEVGGEK